jgi:hypothetical protein
MTTSIVSEHHSGDLWESIENSIDERLGADYDSEKRQRLFAAHLATSSKQATLITVLEQPNGCPATFFKDYMLSERFFFKKAADILGASDFQCLFRFPIDGIDAHLEIEGLEQAAGG